MVGGGGQGPDHGSSALALALGVPNTDFRGADQAGTGDSRDRGWDGLVGDV